MGDLQEPPALLCKIQLDRIAVGFVQLLCCIQKLHPILPLSLRDVHVFNAQSLETDPVQRPIQIVKSIHEGVDLFRNELRSFPHWVVVEFTAMHYRLFETRKHPRQRKDVTEHVDAVQAKPRGLYTKNKSRIHF